MVILKPKPSRRFSKFWQWCHGKNPDQGVVQQLQIWLHLSGEQCMPITSRKNELIEKVQQIVMEDRHAMVQEMAEVGICSGSMHSVLMEDLCIWSVLVKFTCSFFPHNPSYPGEKKTHQLFDRLPTLLTWHSVTWLLLNQKTMLIAERFTSQEEIMRKVMTKLHSIPVAEPLEVCELPKGEFWRGLNKLCEIYKIDFFYTLRSDAF